MSKVIVLGAGMVGSAMATDLSKKHEVTVADINLDVLSEIRSKEDKLSIIQLDVTDKLRLQETIAPFDIVVCAVPGFLGFNTLRAIIEAEKNVVDISFFPENAFDLSSLAEEKKVTAIVDCGVAPGMGNLILGYYNEKNTITDFECLVGGLPKVKNWPYSYKAPFSPVDVIEEYTRPARFVQNGKLVVREPLSDCEFVDFDSVGTLEAFNTDGLRSIIYTMPHIPNMKEKTLRYPGHVEYIKVLKKSGFFDTKEIEVDNTKIVPIEFTSKLLIDKWKLDKNEEEFTVMRVIIKGENKKGESEKITYNLYDEYCIETQTSSMARTTGYTATAAANMVLDGVFSKKGIFPPELIGKYENCFHYIFDYLKARKVNYMKKTVKSE